MWRARPDDAMQARFAGQGLHLPDCIRRIPSGPSLFTMKAGMMCAY